MSFLGHREAAGSRVLRGKIRFNRSKETKKNRVGRDPTGESTRNYRRLLRAFYVVPQN
jgi:hypothetical protein